MEFVSQRELLIYFPPPLLPVFMDVINACRHLLVAQWMSVCLSVSQYASERPLGGFWVRKETKEED